MNRKDTIKLCLSILLVFGLHPVSAQHETSADLISGERAFRQYCANCHGPDGDLIANVDLGHNNFRQPYADEDIVGIILNGIPDTPMPPTPRVTEEQAGMIVAWLRSLGEREEIFSGDSEQGRRLFTGRGGCMDCHMVNGEGSVLGPDLSSIALVRSASELQISLLDPSAEVQPGNRFMTVQTRNGEEITGRLLNHDAFTIQLLDTDEQLRSFDKNSLQSFGFTDPGMPALVGDFSDQEIADLVAYLTTLRRGAPQ